MDFFDRQEQARKQTRRLIFLFGFAVLAVIALTYFILANLILAFSKPTPGFGRTILPLFTTLLELFAEAVMHPWAYLHWLWDGWLAGWITLGCLVSMAGGCLYKLHQLSAGGAAVAELLGGRPVAVKPENLEEQQFRHVVEEMAIASTLPVPEIYVLDNERGINAFAAGHTRDDTAITITRGALKLLSRDELQGLVAHEFSHILNGDTRLNMKLIGLAHGLFWPTILGRVLIYGDSEPLDDDEFIVVQSKRRKMLPTALPGFFLVVIGSLGLPFVRLLKSAICRQREWLADAAAVQFTRNPTGIGGGLKKIGGLFKQGRLDTPHAEVASHLYFANSNYEPWFPWLATHPPLDRRVLAIDPTFDGQFPKVKMLAPSQGERERDYDQVIGGVMRIEKLLPDGLAAMSVGLSAENLRQAMVVRLGLPPEIKAALHTPEDAALVLLSLLLNDDATVRTRQLEVLRMALDASLFARLETLALLVATVEDKYRFPLAEFAVPALRRASPASRVAIHETVQKLVESGDSIGLFEYTLLKMVRRQLDAHFDGPLPETGRYGTVKDVLAESALLLSALAHVGQEEDEAAARKAFAAGAEFLDAPGAKVYFVPRSDWDLAKVDAVLDRLARCPAGVRRNLIMAAGKTVVADGAVTVREAELLRAVAETLNCQLPPFVEAIRNDELAKEA